VKGLAWAVGGWAEEASGVNEEGNRASGAGQIGDVALETAMYSMTALMADRAGRRSYGRCGDKHDAARSDADMVDA